MSDWAQTVSLVAFALALVAAATAIDFASRKPRARRRAPAVPSQLERVQLLADGMASFADPDAPDRTANAFVYAGIAANWAWLPAAADGGGEVALVLRLLRHPGDPNSGGRLLVALDRAQLHDFVDELVAIAAKVGARA